MAPAGKGPERRLVEALEQLAAACVVRAHRARVDDLSQLEQSAIEITETGERLVANASEQPTLCDLHADFDLGLVPRRHRSRGQDRGVVVAPQLGPGRALYARVVAARALSDRTLELIGNDRARHTPPINVSARATLDVKSVTCAASALPPRRYSCSHPVRRPEQLDFDDTRPAQADRRASASSPRSPTNSLVTRQVYLPHHWRVPLPAHSR